MSAGSQPCLEHAQVKEDTSRQWILTVIHRNTMPSAGPACPHARSGSSRFGKRAARGMYFDACCS